MKKLVSTQKAENQTNNSVDEVSCPSCLCTPRVYKGWVEESKICLGGGVSKSFRRLDGRQNEIKNGKTILPNWLEVYIAIQQLQPIAPRKLSEVLKMDSATVSRYLDELKRAKWINEAFANKCAVSGQRVEHYCDVLGVPEKKTQCFIQF